MLAAIALEEAHEYFVSLILVLGSAVSLVASLIYWEGVPESPRLTRAARLGGFLLSLSLLTIGWIWVFGQKGDQHWSRIPRAWSQVVYWFGVKPLTPPGIPGPGDEATLAPMPPVDVVYVPQTEQDTSPWKVYLGTAIIRYPQGFVPGPYASNVIGCDHLVAIDYFTHMEFINQSHESRKIQAYSVEIRTTGGKWKALKRLFFAPDHKVYFLHELGLQLSEIKGLYLLDDSIRESHIEPGKGVGGFALLSYPDADSDVVRPLEKGNNDPQ
jgi:hypothetical protein